MVFYIIGIVASVSFVTAFVVNTVKTVVKNLKEKKAQKGE